MPQLTKIYRGTVRRSLLFAGVAAVVGGMTGCGGSDATDSGGGAGGLGTIRVVSSVGTGLPYFALNHGNDLGAWKDSGLKVDVISADSNAADTLLAAGQAEMTLESTTKPASGIAAGLAAKIVAAHSLEWEQNIIANPDITAVQQLKGKTFGVSGFGSGGYYATLKTAEAMGWSKDDYKISQQGSLDALTAALKSGAIDAFIWNPLQARILDSEGSGNDLGPVRDYVGPIVANAFIASDKVLKDNPAGVRAFLTGYFNLVKRLQADPSPVVDLLLKEGAKREDVEATYQDGVKRWSTDGVMPAEARQGLAESVKIIVPKAKPLDDSIYLDWTTLKQQ